MLKSHFKHICTREIPLTPRPSRYQKGKGQPHILFLRMHFLKLARAFSESQNMYASPLDYSAQKPKHSAPVCMGHAQGTI